MYRDEFFQGAPRYNYMVCSCAAQLEHHRPEVPLLIVHRDYFVTWSNPFCGIPLVPGVQCATAVYLEDDSLVIVVGLCTATQPNAFHRLKQHVHFLIFFTFDGWWLYYRLRLNS